MKKLYILGAVALVAASLTSCDDFLDDHRYPLSVQTANPEFWSSPTNVQGQVDYFYEAFSGYGNGTGYGEFYFRTLSDDQPCPSGSNSMTQWKNISTATASSDWSSPYTNIRRANNIIEGVASSTLAPSDANNFTGIARLMRAYYYFELVKRYGDVPLIDKALNVDDEEMYAPRTARNTVVDFILADLNFAIENIATKSSKNQFSQDLAKAIKAEICLHEAAIAKYHDGDAARAKSLYTEVVSATKDLLTAYPIGSDYKAIYNSFRAELSANSEIIFMKEYEKDVFMHSTLDYTGSSTPIAGISKDAFDAYLFKDGKPLALTTCVKDDAAKAVVGEDGSVELHLDDVLAQRDDRLAQTIDNRVYYAGKQWKRNNTMPMASLTGYGIQKFWRSDIEYNYIATANKNYTSAPLYWGARTALAYMEARVELGQATQDDVDNTLNPLYTRAGLPTKTLGDLESLNDPAKWDGVSSLLWEVMRCRRCEFILDKDTRYWDLVRWHKLDRLDNTVYPNIALGANITNTDVDYANVDGYISAGNGTTRKYEERQYLYPVPTDQITLCAAKGITLTQNPGW